MREERAVQYDIEERGTTVEIHLSVPGELQPMVLGSLQECQEGRCSCPTDQYQRLAAMRLDRTDQDVTVVLEPLAGERLDADQVRAPAWTTPLRGPRPHNAPSTGSSRPASLASRPHFGGVARAAHQVRRRVKGGGDRCR